MLNQAEFIKESIETNLFYLRTLKEFSLNVQTSFLTQDQRLAEEMSKIQKSCEELMERILNNMDGGVSKDALNYQIFVTPYTLDCESLTEKLFGVDINTNLTEQELTLKSGTPFLEETFFNEMKEINEEAYRLADTFVEYGTDIFQSMIKNELFSYSYPTMFVFMLYEIDLYKRELNRILEQAKQDPSAALASEYNFNNSMQTIATFIEKLVDPKNVDITEEARKFRITFQERESLYSNTPLTPESQAALTKEEYAIVQDFQQFLEKCIRQLLSQKAYFIIEPIFLDNMLIQINYFLYRLNMNVVEENVL